MRKIAVFCLSFGLFALPVFAQAGRASRPRVVATPTPAAKTAPVLQNDTPSQNTAKRPPVLTGGNKPPTAQNTNQPTNGEVVEDDNEVIKVETNLVTMPVSVLDRSGRFIAGLQKTDFQIFENNVPQKIEYFASVEKPFSVILMLDVSPSTRYKINEIQDAAIDFVNKLRPDDRVMVISFDERVHVLSPLTGNRAQLRSAIMQTEFGDGTSLYEAVDYTMRQQLKRIEGRKAVVIFTDGVDTTSKRANYQSTVAEAQELDALVYPVRFDTFDGGSGGNGGGNYPYPRRRRGGNSGGGILGDILGGIMNGGITISGGGYPSGGGSSGGSRSEYETGRRYLQELAYNSGGRMFEASNNLDTAFSGIAEELRRQYSVGYYPEKEGLKGERRSIRVRVMKPDLVVRAKNSYIVGENDNQKLAGK